jgi:uroporphyrin-III C-methyltransferase/precorrin-2 dehydrogenase/sirohydrochlorin ferrochelatase
MEFFPVFFDLRGRLCLVVGGGVAAADKAALLVAAGARIAVIAETLDPRFDAWIAAGICEHRATRFDAADLAGATLVISAASEPLDRAVSETARARALPVNIVDRRELSSFIMPAIIDRSPVVVAVSTGGAAPMLARLLRDRIARALPRNCGRLAALARHFRPLVHATLADIPARRRFWHGILSGPTAGLIEAGDESAARAELRRALRAQTASTPAGGAAGTQLGLREG